MGERSNAKQKSWISWRRYWVAIQQQCDHQPKSPFQSWRWLVANAKGGKTLMVFVFCLTLAWRHPLQKNNTQSTNNTSSVIPSHIIEYYKILKLIHAGTLLSFLPNSCSAARLISMSMYMGVWNRNYTVLDSIANLMLMNGTWRRWESTASKYNNNNDSILCSSQQEIKAVIQSYTLTHNEELNCIYFLYYISIIQHH